MTRGLVQVYTGNGKGKTTAAWGQAVRAVGQGMRVAVVRFLKPNDSGEVKASACLGPLLSVFGECSPYNPSVNQKDSSQVREDNRRNFDMARELLLSGGYDMLVLDEINMVLYYEHVTHEEMTALLDESPDGVEIVLTGRNAPQWLIDAADLVTEMREVKHPSSGGIEARKGIEY
jgi:cob(I)alamin adenosyltransferase